jgi:hypothetical protein
VICAKKKNKARDNFASLFVESDPNSVIPEQSKQQDDRKRNAEHPE